MDSMNRRQFLKTAAVTAGVTIVHCVIKQRTDGRGGNQNTAFAAIARKRIANWNSYSR